jgi:flagellar hook-associated protein 2
LVAVGQTSATGAIGTGASTTLTFEFGTIAGGTLSAGIYTGASFTQDGSVPAGTVTIDAPNNSLQGVRDAINSANLGVTASIVKDGSAAPYRLVLQSDGSGAARSLRVSVSGDPAVQALLAYDASGTQNLTQSVAAQDAKLSINGVAISSSSNVVGDALEGVSLNVAKVGSTVLTLARDTAGVTQALQALVKAYNDFNTTLSELTKYDPQTRQGGPLLVTRLRERSSPSCARHLTALPGLQTSSVRILAQAGIAFQRDGSLAFDAGKLGEALASRPDDVARLFASLGTATDAQVRVISSGTRTAPGLYSVDVTTLASQGTLTGSAPAGLTISAGVNDALSVTVDGVAASVTLAAGTYTPSALAAQVQAAGK